MRTAILKDGKLSNQQIAHRKYYLANREKILSWHKENKDSLNAYARKYAKKRRILMNTGKIPYDKQFQRQIESWVDRTYIELRWLDDHMYDGYIDLNQMYKEVNNAVSKMRVSSVLSV